MFFDASALQAGVLSLIKWQIPVAMATGIPLGLILGAIPGVTGSLGIAILLPMTFYMEPLNALIFLTSIYSGSLAGGAITAILVNTPGTPGAMATTFDGYPMTKLGRQNEAIGIGMASSVTGGFLSYVFLLFFIQPLARFALGFGPSEMIMLTVFVLIIIGALRGRSLLRSVFIGLCGLLLGTVGTSEATGVIRGAFGVDFLIDGFPHVTTIIAMFALPELLEILEKETISRDKEAGASNWSLMRKGIFQAFHYPRTLLRSSAIGIIIGALPAAGSTIASILSYSQSKRNARPGQRFGEGEPEGVVASEAANNASEGGAMAILMALGIPGSGTTAILVAGFMIHGLMPGPYLFRDHSQLVYGIIVGNLIQMAFLAFFAVVISIYLSNVVYVPTRLLAPALIAVMAFGAFAVRSAVFDVYILVAVGVLSWLLRRSDFPATSFVIGFLLGRPIENEVYRFAALFGSDFLVFFRRPVSLGLLLLTVFTIVWYTRKSLIQARAEASEAPA